MSYAKQTMNVFRRYKDTDNNSKIEKSIFEVNELLNLGTIISYNNLRDIKEESYIKKQLILIFYHIINYINFLYFLFLFLIL